MADPRAAYVDWSEDSRTVYYLAAGPGEQTSVWAVPVAGGEPQADGAVRRSHAAVASIRVFGAQGRFWLTVGDRQSDIWVAEVAGAR